VLHYSLPIIELQKTSIAIIVKSLEQELLLRLIKNESRSKKMVDVKLHGAANLSKSSFCMDCSKPIIDQSRTRKRKRCEICRKSHIKKICKIHATRISAEKRKEKELRKKKKDC